MGRETTLPLTATLLLHVVLIALLSISFSSKQVKHSAPPPAAEVVEAVAVDDAKVQAELKRLQQQEKQRKAQLTSDKRKAEKAKKARQAEERRIKALKKKQAEEKRKQQAAEKKRKAEAEKKLKAEQERVARLKQEQLALEKKQAEEKARLAELEKQRKIEAEKRRKAKEEAKRKAEEERKRKEAEQALKKRMAEEQSRLQAERNRQLASMLLTYQDLVAGKVRRNWTRPVGSKSDFSCKVLVQQLPDGDVVGVQLLESCGNPALDRSVESAVRKASPLPKPPDPELFDREIEFTFKPEL